MNADGRILIADDEDGLRWVLEKGFRSAGYQVTAVKDGTAALREVDAGPFDLILALGVLPRAPEPGPALDVVRGLLAPGGTLVAALPPILDGQSLELHRARPGEPSSLYLWDWESELADRFPRVRLFRHLPPEGRLPDLANPGPATLDAADYCFEEIPRAEIYDVGSLTALFVCEP